MLTSRLSAGTLQLMSPTTFWTGSLILGGLFIYDIVMVFYTYANVTFPISSPHSSPEKLQLCNEVTHQLEHKMLVVQHASAIENPAYQRIKNFFWYP